MNDHVDLLRRAISEFRDLEAEEAAALVESLGETRTLARKGPEWEHADDAGYVVLEGWLIRSITLPDGRRQIIDFLLPGDVVCRFRTRRDTGVEHVRNLTAARVAVISEERLGRLLEERCHLAFAFLCAAARTSERLKDHVLRLGRLAAYERTAHLLLDLRARLQRIGLANDHHYTLPVTQEELADALGLSAVHLNRVMRTLTRDGLVEVTGRAARTAITVRDVPRLSAVATHGRRRAAAAHA
jgi:CRP-like cAMP-binding protein